MTSLQKLTELERIIKEKELGNDPYRIKMFGMLYTKHSDKTANNLTKAVIRWIQIHGGQAERINTMGRFIQGATVSKGFYGSKQLKGKYIPTTSTKGSADISATIKGRSVKIEIKIGMDKQSDAQRKYQSDVETAGGTYWLVRSFDGFIEKWEGLCGY